MTPAERPFLTAEWRNLLMINFAVDPKFLAPLVPAGTVLDAHAGVTFVSLVAFRFLGTRVLGLPIPFHRNFEEMNLRFYVRRELPTEVRRAVVFIKEIVPRWAIACLARALYNEPYATLPMRNRVGGDPPQLEYGWRIGGEWLSLRARAHGIGAVPDPRSVEAFITEHYWGYTRQRDGCTLEYRVEHPRWRVWSSELSDLPDLEGCYGKEMTHALGRPKSTMVADGSPVRVMRGRRFKET